MSGFLDREKILRLFDELSSELQRTRTRVQIYVIGGAAMSLAFARDRMTEDVDARIDSGHGQLTRALQAVGRRYGLGDSWLNEAATTAIPRARDTRARTAYESRWLTVTGASPEHLLAMKLLAARNRDREDIGTLVEFLKLKTPEDAERIYQELFPAEPMKDRAREMLRAAIPVRSADRGAE